MGVAKLCAPGPADRQREQARVRQARQRRRARADRLDLQAEAEAAKLPLAWRSEFLDVVRSARSRAEKALIQVEKSALLLSEGATRDAYLKRNHRNTKVSVARLFNEFVRRKTNLARVELHRDAEYDRDHNDHRPEVEDIEWGDLQAIAWILGDPADSDLAALQPMARFIGSILLASISVGNTLIGFAQAIEMFRFLDAMRMRQADAHSA
jgi:hypothetical protein